MQTSQKEYLCHTNLERAQGSVAVLYMMKYAFKIPFLYNVSLMRINENDRSFSNPSRDNNHNDISLKMKASVLYKLRLIRSFLNTVLGKSILWLPPTRYTCT